ncbi:MAG: hypothetical protein ACREJD_13760 [Phycisphaerales bacterium]
MLGVFHSHYKLRMQMTLFFLCIGLLVFSAYTCYAEARYFATGRTISATLVKVEEVRQKRDEDPSLRVTYSFPDGGGAARQESDIMAADWPLPPSGAVNVQYIPGRADWSRVSGHDKLWFTLPFIICATIVAVFLIKFYREFQEHERRKALR